MESVPQHLDTDQIMADIKNIDGILDVHEFHLWSITTEHYSLSAHVVLDKNMRVMIIKRLIKYHHC